MTHPFKHLLSVIALLTTLMASAQTLPDGIQAIDYDKNEAARDILHKLTEKEPANGLNNYYLGRAYINLYRLDSARMAFNRGVQADPLNPANYAGLGELLLEEGKTEAAREQFNKALSFSKTKDGRVKDVQALRVVAHSMVLAENKLIDEAVALIEQALEQKRTYEIYLTAGDIYLEKNDGGKSASMYEKAIEKAPKNPQAYVRVANIWLRVKNADATLNELNRALQIDSNYAPVLKALAEYYSQTRQYEKAKLYFERYLSNSENSTSNRARYARILFRNKDYNETLLVITDLLSRDESDLYMYRLGGYSYFEVGNDNKDTSKFRPGAALLQHFVDRIDTAKILSSDYEYLGKLYARIPEMDSLAVVYINLALQKDPQKIELYREAGLIYNRIRRFDQAILCFETYIAKSGKPNAADYYMLGIASNYGKEYAKADSAFGQINILKPDYAEAYYFRGLAVGAMDPEFKTPAAKDHWEKFVSLAESNPDKFKKYLISSYNYIAKYYIKQDENTRAKEYLNKLLALDPDNKEAKDIIRQLDAPPPPAKKPARKK